MNEDELTVILALTNDKEARTDHPVPRQTTTCRRNRRECSLDEVLEGVSVRPLLGERGSVPHRGEVSQPQTVLHAFVTARHLLLFGLGGGRTEHHITSPAEVKGLQ